MKVWQMDLNQRWLLFLSPSNWIEKLLTFNNLKDKADIRITDNGIRNSNIILDKISQPFFTSKPTSEGTGLGLSLSYDIVTEVHGGELKVESEEGKSTEFIIKIPKD